MSLHTTRQDTSLKPALDKIPLSTKTKIELAAYFLWLLALIAVTYWGKAPDGIEILSDPAISFTPGWDLIVIGMAVALLPRGISLIIKQLHKLPGYESSVPRRTAAFDPHSQQPQGPRMEYQMQAPKTRFCGNCGNENHKPWWKWAAGLAITIGVLIAVLLITAGGWIFWIPFGPVADLTDIAARKLRREDWLRGYQQGIEDAQKRLITPSQQ